MSTATMRDDAGFCPVIMHPVLTAKGDMSATARQYLAPFCNGIKLVTNLTAAQHSASLVRHASCRCSLMQRCGQGSTMSKDNYGLHMGETAAACWGRILRWERAATMAS